MWQIVRICHCPGKILFDSFDVMRTSKNDVVKKRTNLMNGMCQESKNFTQKRYRISILSFSFLNA